MTLIAVAVTVAYIYSLAVAAGVEGMVFFELVTLIDVMLLGHWIEMKSVKGASDTIAGALRGSCRLKPTSSDGKVIDVPIESLKLGDLVLVRSGERVPSDGTVIKGSPMWMNHCLPVNPLPSKSPGGQGHRWIG